MRSFKKLFFLCSIPFAFCTIKTGWVDTPFFQDEHENFLQHIKKIDKVELHLHLGGSWPIEFLATIAEPHQLSALYYLLKQFDDSMHYHEAFKVFDVISRIVDTEEKVENGVAALCKNLSADGVTYVEIRTGARDMGSGLEGYLQAVLRGIERGSDQSPLKVTIILSVRRDTPAHIVDQTIGLINKYRNRGVIGIDISGISTQGNGDTIFQFADRIKRDNIPVTLHIGESPQESPEQQMKELQLLSPKRVGHCVHLCDEALKLIRENKIPIEMCLSSAVKTRMIDTYDQHPGLRLLREGHPVVICTDDPLIFNTSLSEECARVAYINRLAIKDMQYLQNAALAYCFS